VVPSHAPIGEEVDWTTSPTRRVTASAFGGMLNGMALTQARQCRLKIRMVFSRARQWPITKSFGDPFSYWSGPCLDESAFELLAPSPYPDVSEGLIRTSGGPNLVEPTIELPATPAYFGLPVQ